MGPAPDPQLAAAPPAPDLAGRRVRFVLPSLELGGAERQALLLAGGLRDRCGAQVEVWGLNSTGLVSQLCDEAGLPWRIWPCPWPDHPRACRRELLRFAAALRESPVDVLMPYCGLPNLLCGTVWRWAGAQASIWSQRDEGRDRAPRWVEALAVANTPQFISNSAEGAGFLTRTLGVPSARIELIHNGVCLAPAKADRRTWRQRLGLADATPIACMVANLHGFKDHATLVRAWKLVSDQARPAPPPMLLLAGRPGNAQGTVAALIAELGLTNIVRLLGQVGDVPGLLGAADFMVHSALAEGLPNAVLEAMAAGLPVVGTDLTGLREALGPAADACLAPPRDPQALAARIGPLVRDPGLRAAQGAANRQRIADAFSADRLVRTTATLIARVLQTPAPSLPARALWHTRWLLAAPTRVAAHAGAQAVGRLRHALRRTLCHLPGTWRLVTPRPPAPTLEEGKR